MFIYSGPTLNLSASILAGSLLILLPISGANGLLYVPGIAVWMFIRARKVGGLAGQGNPVMRFVGGSAPSPAVRPAQIVMLGSAAASVAISIAYFVGYKRVSHPWPTPDILRLMSATVHVLGAGRVLTRVWRYSGRLGNLSCSQLRQLSLLGLIVNGLQSCVAAQSTSPPL